MGLNSPFIEYFDKDFLAKVGSKIGKVIRIDQNTATAERGQFTRLSVELDLSKPLLSKFWLKGKVWKIQYEGLRMICYKCGKIGHLDDKCPLNDDNHNNNVAHGDEVPQNPDSPSQQILQQDFGSWMVVKKPPPRRRQPRADKPPDKPPEVAKLASNFQKKLNFAQNKNIQTKGAGLEGS